VKKFVNRYLIICTIIVVFCSKPVHAEDSISVGAVKAEKVPIYTAPKFNSHVMRDIKKGEEYPILGQKDASNFKLHTAAMGETLYLIAKRYEVTVDDLKRVNQILGTRLYVGQKLIIPQEMGEHLVDNKPDALWKIARKYNVSASTLIEVNGLKAIVLEPGAVLKIPAGYYKLQLLGGTTGWVNQSYVDVQQVKRFNLGWKYNGTPAAYQKQLHINGLDVVSPRWYTLSRTDLVEINENIDYAKEAAKAGKEVWPLFGNKFDPELTNEILKDPTKREKIMKDVTQSLRHTQSQGINVDFENIDPKNKQDFVKFVQELKTRLEPYDISVSVDVSRENADPFWSGSLDREGLGKVADFIVVMGYDEHWASSPKAGSVASIPWTSEGIKLLMKEVPAHKIILGVPFYTREWITNANGEVRSIDRTMLETEKLIQQKKLTKKWDRKTSQNYVEFMENGEKHQIWVEDKESMKLRYDLVKKYNLRGTAAWYVGGASEDIWNILN
jgi:spore germination protein